MGREQPGLGWPGDSVGSKRTTRKGESVGSGVKKPAPDEKPAKASLPRCNKRSEGAAGQDIAE